MRSVLFISSILTALVLAGCQSSGGSSSAGSNGDSGGSGGGDPAALAGKWELDIVTDSEPHLVLEVAADDTAKLLSATGFGNQQYASIKFVETKTGINVVVEEVQKCGNRTVTYTTAKSGNDYVGSVSGPNADCKSGTFQSPADAVKLVRQTS